MATLPVVFFLIVGFSLAPSTDAAGAAPDTITCTDKELKKVIVDKPGTLVNLKCPAESAELWPAQTQSAAVTTVGTNAKCDQSTSLESVCPGASGQCTGKGALSLSFPQLPKTASELFFSCQETPPKAGKVEAAAGKGCSFQLSVKAYSPQGPQICAIPGGTVDLAVVGDGGRALFGCGKGMTLNPTDPKKIFGGDCLKEETLKHLERTVQDDGYFALTATKKPDTKKYCYLCAQGSREAGQSTTNCAVLISVSAASGFAARSTFGLALSCALAVMYLA